jgi:virginiamycin B lyase
MTTGPDGNLWFIGCIGNVIVSIAPSGTNAQTPYAVPNTTYGQALPFMVVTGPDKNLWFTSCGGGTISRLAVPKAGSQPNPTVFRAPSAQGRGQLWGLAPGPNNDLWMADIGGQQIDRIPASASSAAQMAAVPVSASPWWMVTGPDGAIWFTETTRGNGVPPNGKIGRIVP